MVYVTINFLIIGAYTLVISEFKENNKSKYLPVSDPKIGEPKDKLVKNNFKPKLRIIAKKELPELMND